MNKPVTWCSRELVRSPYFFGLCKSEADFHRELRRLGLSRDEYPQWLGGSAHAKICELTHLKTKRRLAIVCIDAAANRKVKRKRCEIDGLLVHEAVHLWRWIKEDIGEREPSSEFEAYSVQHIAQELMYAYHGS